MTTEEPENIDEENVNNGHHASEEFLHHFVIFKACLADSECLVKVYY